MKQQRCLIAMSGGVDSSVAAALMQQAGYDCVGATMKLFPCPCFDEDALEKGFVCGCPDNACDVVDAMQICKRLGIPHHTLRLEHEFEARVVKPFVDAYVAGSTPNPCITCNRHLKFAALLAWAHGEGIGCLATGHYARVEGGRLFKAKDARKDQSYVLYTLSGEQLRQLRFPLGEYSKDEVRKLAAELGFSVADKEESQDICFVPQGNYTEFIETYLRLRKLQLPRPGNIVNTSGAVLGTHRGVHHYTVGQRRGLGVSGPEPLYVLDIDAPSATLRVGSASERGEQVALLSEVNIIDPGTPVDGRSFSVRHRYQGREHDAQVFLPAGNTARIVFSKKQPDLTRGQALVIYDGDRVVGGGTITATE
ncbi:MAG: tRNA 2-thiouridine(34) synthase MnmA [Coriobacteriales bacterium]|jgi:tRNA-specific 2-thiouridylase|nr:tRNA 2-thiouridine(34) synthase MnmA [Coriobacteriales bacterium]